MSVLAPLAAWAGRRAGAYRLHDPHTGGPDDSDSTVVVVPVCGGRFVRLDYTWAYRGAPHDGSLLVGFEKGGGAATVHWVDSWHMGDAVLACRGPVGPGGVIDVRGSYAAPPGPDWGWRTVVTPGADALAVVMYNVTPDGQEAVAVEATYPRG